MQKRIGLPSEDGLRLSNERRGAPLGSKGDNGIAKVKTTKWHSPVQAGENPGTIERYRYTTGKG